MKIPQFLPDQAESWAILPIHGIVIFTKFQVNWANIVGRTHILFRSDFVFVISVQAQYYNFQICSILNRKSYGQVA